MVKRGSLPSESGFKVGEVQRFTETVTTGVWLEIAHFQYTYCRVCCPQCFAITHVNPLRTF